MNARDIARYWNWSSTDPEARAQEALDYMRGNLRRFLEHVNKLAGMDGVDPSFDPAEEYGRFVAKHKELHRAYWEAIGRTANPMITGRAKFPVERNRRANEIAVKRFEAIEDHLEKAMKAAERKAFPYGMKGDPVKNEDPEAVSKLEERLERLKGLQAKMKEANRLFRSGDDQALIEMGFSPEQVEEWRTSTDIFKAGPPFKSFDLASVRGKIKRVEERLVVLKRRAERLEREGGNPTYVVVPGMRIVENLELDRLQLFFDGKPKDEVRALLKRNGFKWAPSKGAWQRKLTDNAKRAVRYIVDEILKGGGL